MRGFFLVEVFGFVMLIDYRYDRSDDAGRAMMSHPVPEPWLPAHPGVEAPLSREIAASPGEDPETLFEALIDRAIAEIGRLRTKNR